MQKREHGEMVGVLMTGNEWLSPRQRWSRMTHACFKATRANPTRVWCHPDEVTKYALMARNAHVELEVDARVHLGELAYERPRDMGAPKRDPSIERPDDV